jgi:hypothetical protein
MEEGDWITGEVDGALAFDGIDEYVEITGYKGVLGTQSRTITAWVKANTAGEQPIVNYGDAGAGAGARFCFRIHDSGKLAVEVTGDSVRSDSDVLLDNEWHHVAVVHTSGGTCDEMQLYIDGQPDNTPAVSGTDVNTASGVDVAIGNRTTNYFTGSIDDVRIYDSALDASDILEIYTGPAPMVVAEGPVWSFTTTSGKACEPIYPENGGEAAQPLVLTWGTCFGVLSHDVFIGRYAAAVAVADTDSPEFQGNVDVNSFACPTLNIGQTYYWRIDEHYAGDEVVSGDVWMFSLLDRMPIEDFEDYTSDSNMRLTWGGHYPESAAFIYLEEFDGAEDTDQSMEIWYANQYSPYFSEGYRSYLGHYESTWDPWTQTGEIIYVPLDMTAGQIGAIDLWWHGQSGMTMARCMWLWKMLTAIA